MDTDTRLLAYKASALTIAPTSLFLVSLLNVQTYFVRALTILVNTFNLMSYNTDNDLHLVKISVIL